VPAEQCLENTVDTVLDTLPPVWDRIRSNLRAAGTEKFGITLEQFHDLRHIRKGYSSVRDLADKRQISRPAVSQAVAVLVAKGLVARSGSSEDRRRQRLELTPRAAEVLDANYQENRAWMRAKMAQLSSGELETVRCSMEILRGIFAPGEA